MLEAQLHGKLSVEQERLEDLLTSNVFGSIKYVPFEKGLIPLLRNVENEKGDFPLKDIGSIVDVKYEFWPQLSEDDCKRCEPDVLITITHELGKKTIILVEAKYLSGKSSEATDEEEPNDQLAREWDNLSILSKKDNQILLYITADMSYPQIEIEQSKKEYIEKRIGQPSLNIVWLSWREVTKIFSKSQEMILIDLVKVLKKQGLKFYDGITKCDFSEIHWHFIPEPMHLSWSTTNYPIEWRFGE